MVQRELTTQETLEILQGINHTKKMIVQNGDGLMEIIEAFELSLIAGVMKV